MLKIINLIIIGVIAQIFKQFKYNILKAELFTFGRASKLKKK